MFRVSRYLNEILHPAPPARGRAPAGPVVIWNMVRRCNLACRHCYAFSADVDYPGELSTAEACAVMDDLKAFGVPVLILSGGEPLLRADLLALARRAKVMGFYVGLSTNGTLIDAPMAERLATVGFDYVGISLDGKRETHDAFRRKAGAFDASMAAIGHCHAVGIKVGLRTTLTQHNAGELEWLLDLADDERVGKFYLSHLNYSGRGNLVRGQDAWHETTRRAVLQVVERAWRHARAGTGTEFVTGNNDADAILFLQWVRRHHPEHHDRLRAQLVRWGGNASGRGIANIDNVGDVHPDTYWWDYPVGNVRERPFSAIWSDRADPIMAGLNASPRPLKGRCGACAHRDVCNGNTRTRARQVSGDPWEEDPGCYLTDAEIGLAEGSAGPRLAVTPWSRRVTRRAGEARSVEAGS